MHIRKTSKKELVCFVGEQNMHNVNVKANATIKLIQLGDQFCHIEDGN